MKANITFTSVLTPITNIEERNAAFYTLSLEDRRKEIAWDHLQLILQGKLTASYGTYWAYPIETHVYGYKSKQLQDYFLLNPPICEVCQRGGLMISRIRLGNNLDGDVIGLNKGSYKGKPIIEEFDIMQLEDMEKEFEACSFDHPYDSNTNAKMANICCNIIVNRFFNVNDKSNYLNL